MLGILEEGKTWLTDVNRMSSKVERALNKWRILKEGKTWLADVNRMSSKVERVLNKWKI
jgi:hypothetical protein